MKHVAVEYLQKIEETYPSLWRLADEVQSRFGRGVGHKEGCVFTRGQAELVGRALPGDDLACSPIALGALIAWRPTKGIYRFHPALYEALCETDLSGNIPSELLRRMPGYAVFIESPGLQFIGFNVLGFWAYLSSSAKESAIEFVWLIDEDGLKTQVLSLPFGPYSVSDVSKRAIEAMLKETEVEYAPREDEWRSIDKTLSSMLSLVLYLCSEKPEIESWRQPVPKAKFFGKQKRWLQAKEVTEWAVGVRLGAALAKANAAREAEEREFGSGSSKRPHIRNPHWHSYWVGKRGAQSIVLHWLPPIPVNINADEVSTLPAVIRPV